MKRSIKRIVLLLLVAATAVTVHSCGDGGGGTPPRQNRPPVATGTIPAAELFVGDTLTLDVSAYFNDPDGDALSYTVGASDTRVVSARVSGSVVTVSALAQGDAVVTVTATDAGGLSAEQSFTVDVPNRAPEATAAIPAAELYVEESLTVDLAAHFEDPDGDALVFSTEVSAPAVAEVTVTDGELTVSALAQGEAVVAVTATDAGGLSAEQSFTVTVPNRVPEATAAIPAAELRVEESLTVDLAAHFEDPDGDALVFSTEVSAPAVAEVTVTDGELTVSALARGEAFVTVTAQDAGGLSAEQSFGVIVQFKSGYLYVELQHDQPDVGGLAIQLVGPVVDSLRAAPELTLYGTATDEGMRLVFLGPIAGSGTLLSFWTDDVTRVDEYMVHVVEAVAITYEPRTLDGSSIRVRR